MRNVIQESKGSSEQETIDSFVGEVAHEVPHKHVNILSY